MLLDLDQARNVKDTLAKTVYSRVFNWVVFAVNQVIDKSNERHITLGILDIYGDLVKKNLKFFFDATLGEVISIFCFGFVVSWSKIVFAH